MRLSIEFREPANGNAGPQISCIAIDGSGESVEGIFNALQRAGGTNGKMELYKPRERDGGRRQMVINGDVSPTDYEKFAEAINQLPESALKAALMVIYNRDGSSKQAPFPSYEDGSFFIPNTYRELCKTFGIQANDVPRPR